MATTTIAGPLGWSLTGVTAGVCAGMLIFGYAGGDYGRVHLGQSLPCAVLGCVFGALIGLGVEFLWRRFSRYRRAITIISAGALAAGIGGMFGWITGDGFARGVWENEKTAQLGMAIGVACGGLVGMLMGAVSRTEPLRTKSAASGEPR